MPSFPNLDFTLCVPSSSPFNSLCPQTSQTAPALARFVDAATVSGWIRKFTDTFTQFEKIEKNSIYHILEKAIQDITPLLEEGQKLSVSQGHYFGVTQAINELV